MNVPASTLMTADAFAEFCALHENAERHFELVDGEVIEMSRPGDLHGVYCWWIGGLFMQFVLKRGRGIAYSNDPGFVTRQEPDTVRGLDVVLYNESRPRSAMTGKWLKQPPALVVEVLSPHDRPNEVVRKVVEYLNGGVSLVWVVDPEACTVLVYRRERAPELKIVGDMLAGEGSLADLAIPVADLFNYPGAYEADANESKNGA